MKRILAIGDLTVDYLLGPFARLPEWGQEVVFPSQERRVGGNTGNFALAARDLGLDVMCWGPVGSDDHGRWLLQNLAAAGVDTSLVVVDDELGTSVASALVREDGERAFLTFAGALESIPSHLEELPRIAADAAIFSGWCQPPRVSPAVLSETIARLRAGIPTIAFDLAWFDASWLRPDDVVAVLSACDVVLMNEDELGALFPGAPTAEALSRLAARMPKAQLVIKQGPAGVLLRRGSEDTEQVPVHDPVENAASVGTGDAFNAAFLAGTTRGWSASDSAGAAVAYVSHILRNGRGSAFALPLPTSFEKPTASRGG